MRGDTNKDNLIVINYHIHTETSGKTKTPEDILADFRRVGVQAYNKAFQNEDLLDIVKDGTISRTKFIDFKNCFFNSYKL